MALIAQTCQERCILLTSHLQHGLSYRRPWLEAHLTAAARDLSACSLSLTVWPSPAEVFVFLQALGRWRSNFVLTKLKPVEVSKSSGHKQMSVTSLGDIGNALKLAEAILPLLSTGCGRLGCGDGDRPQSLL